MFMSLYSYHCCACQDWSDIRIAADVVYPLYYFIGVSYLVVGTSAVLYLAGVIGYVF